MLLQWWRWYLNLSRPKVSSFEMQPTLSKNWLPFSIQFLRGLKVFLISKIKLFSSSNPQTAEDAKTNSAKSFRSNKNDFRNSQGKRRRKSLTEIKFSPESNGSKVERKKGEREKKAEQRWWIDLMGFEVAIWNSIFLIDDTFHRESLLVKKIS